MQEQEFITAVRESLDLPDNASAGTAVRATLAVLGRRLSGGEGKDLASQLPGSLAQQIPDDAPGERFDVTTFYQRIAEAERAEGREVTDAQARQHARAIAKGLETALSNGEWRNFTSQLPKDYADFLGTEPVEKH
ncbi:DUF2267 domain-containing protein [Actinomycetospora sp. TBRC 11914]|uniref:DUF2267 domain-containing protein n=1 Tax=Actinomycetospora sp. TBRC 11914 TaxID=2729387 RepID=UPI00145E9C42|nr:DUF2267 domain-containing protein [Actinomycetospora sp. TBRC 11914]NMO91002.1 DUF2267 domain-containing protein [Actinomycetospora sp. TBRC 11914]